MERDFGLEEVIRALEECGGAKHQETGSIFLLSRTAGTSSKMTFVICWLNFTKGEELIRNLKLHS